MPYRFFSRALPWYRVLDIGSGDEPHPRANILVDSFVSDAHRQGRLNISKPIVLARAESLPFRDNSFDLALSAHCLEHCDNPAIAVGEMCRVARRGIIEVPSPYLEHVMSPNNKHRWIFAIRDDELIYSENPYRHNSGSLGFAITMKLLNESRIFRSYYLNQDQIFRIRLRWRGIMPVFECDPVEIESVFIRSLNRTKIASPMSFLAERAIGRIIDRSFS